MASIIDASNALVNAIAALLYPDGVDQDNPDSAAGCPCKVFAGWPIPHQLDADMAAGVVNVSIYPRPGMERVTTRYIEQWATSVAPVATITLTIAGQTITVGGTVSVPQVAAVYVQGIAYPYDIQEADTLDDVAAGLAALLAADYPSTTSVGAVVTLPLDANLQDARVAAQGTVVKELRRQEKGFQVCVWAPTPAAREAVGSVIDTGFARSMFMAAPDGTAVRAVYASNNISDEHQKTVIYRYDMFLTVEYGTTVTEQQMQIISPVVNLTAQPAVI